MDDEAAAHVETLGVEEEECSGSGEECGEGEVEEDERGWAGSVRETGELG
jgi:hypothetical protein